MERKPYILYRRASGGKGGKIFYVAFWDPETRNYTNRRSTNQTARAPRTTRRGNGSLKGLRARDCRNLRRISGRILGRRIPVPCWQGGAAQTALGYLRDQLALAIAKYVEALAHRERQGEAPALRRHGWTARIPDAAPSGAWVSAHRESMVSSRQFEFRSLTLRRWDASAKTRPGRSRSSRTRRRKAGPRNGGGTAVLRLEWKDPRYYGINLLAATTGMRLGEIRGLQAEDIREDYIHVCHNWQDTEPEGRKMKGPKHSTLANRKGA